MTGQLSLFRATSQRRGLASPRPEGIPLHCAVPPYGAADCIAGLVSGPPFSPAGEARPASDRRLEKQVVARTGARN